MNRPTQTRRRCLCGALLLLLLLCLLLPATIAGAVEIPPTIRVGWALRPGMTQVDDGVYSGYNYDFLMEIAKYTGWTYEFVVDDVSTLLEMLEKGEIDLQGSLLYSDERAEAVDFAELEYGNKYTVLFTAQDSSLHAYDFEAWEGMRVGVLRDDTASQSCLEDFATSGEFSYTAVEYDTAEAFIAAVSDGEVDAGVMDGFVDDPGFRVLAGFSPIPYYFATTKGNDAVLHELNRALWQINVDRPHLERELYNKYFDIQFDPALTESERALVKESEVTPITVGVIPSSAPACYWNEEKGEYAGIFMEILKTISQKTGMQFTYQALDLSKGAPIAQLKQGYPDLVAGIVQTQRFLDDAELALSDVLLNDSLVVVGRKGEDFTQNPTEKSIAIPKGFQVAEEYVATQFPSHASMGFATAEDCLDAVKDGKADAAIYMRTCINHFLQNPHYENLEAIPAYSCDVNTCAAGLSANKSAIVNIMNKGLAMITENERNSIIMNATVMNPYQMTVGDMIYKYRVPLAIIAVLFLIVVAVLVAMNLGKRQSEKKLQLAYEQEKAAFAVAEQASAAKGNFMSRMSHEIRTPLNAIIGYNTIARSEISEAKSEAQRRQAEMKVMDCLTKSDIASQHLLTIINDVLDMSSIESGKLKLAQEKFDFKGLITSLTAMFYAQARAKGLSLEVVFDALTEEWFVGDPVRVNQILTNLLANAIKFTSDGGAVKLSICQPEAETNAAHIHFEIEDTGIGMDEAYLEHIWAPFEQADSSISRRFGGTGLGLSITKNLVDLMGGRITVESEREKGSTFCVDLTFLRTEQPNHARTCDFSEINALVVDDDPSTCDYIKLLFDRCGARCAYATSGEDALFSFARAKEKGDPYTLCLVDWCMPSMDGVETIRRIRSMAGEDVPISVITAYDFSEIMEQAAKVGVETFLAKPLFQSSLMNLLANISGEQVIQRIEKPTQYDFSGARVLLVEDNVMNMEIAKKILQSSGLTIDSAWNGQEAVDMFAAVPAGTYQAILMDIQMPVLDGHQATRRIRALAHEEAASIPIIAMTADAFVENVVASLESGMNDHISKPIDLPTLFQTLEKYLSNRAR